jgi:ATP-dependent helicase/nuclease subunit B
MSQPRATILPAALDLPDWAARRIVANHSADLPDLSRVTVLLPAWPAARDLRRRLVQHAKRGLLGPQIHLPGSFAASRAADGPALSALDCRLLLAEALARYRNLFPGQDTAQVTDALFTLFEELTANEADLAQDEAQFTETLQKAYKVVASQARRAHPLTLLSFEAQIVHKLWRAFLTDSAGRSPAMVYRQRLPRAFAALGKDEKIYLLGFDELSRAESSAFAAVLRTGQAELWLQGRLEGRDGEALRELCTRLQVQPEVLTAETDARSSLLDAAFASDAGDAPPRSGPEPLPIRIVEADGPEHEARCVELAVRQALLDGETDVAVLTEDRRLARRLRALLERAGIPLQDHVGWALSTSQAAATLEAWLDCLDTDFHFRPLLELLKSGFIGAPAPALLELERDLVYGKHVEGNLDHFISAARSSPMLLELLRRLKTAARFSGPLHAVGDAAQWASALLQALDALGLNTRWREDAAGARLLDLLEQMMAALRRAPLRLDFDGFRILLARAIDRETFIPEAGASPVRLLTLEQSHNLRSGTLIVAGATREQLPGAAAAEPFFNQSVRLELGLPGWQQRQALALARLRRVLQAAPKIWITYAPESILDVPQLSPWLEAVDALAQSCGRDLRDTQLAQLAGTAAVEISEPGGVKVSVTLRPAPPAPADLLPRELSATAHQALVDCPYRFYAQSILKLDSKPAPDEDPDRSDYGRHVHRILQAFSEQLSGLPPPFPEPVTRDNRAQAQQKLEHLADAVLAKDLQSRALARTWLTEFRASIPAFLDWLMERGPLREVRAEVPLEKNLGAWKLTGKADRLETREDGAQVVVDYKTGRLPRKADLESLEAVQLLHYAALDPRIAAVEYFPLKEGLKPLALEEHLAEARQQVEQRLGRSLERMQAQAALPAHGADDICEYCDYAGLCRKGDWHE